MKANGQLGLKRSDRNLLTAWQPQEASDPWLEWLAGVVRGASLLRAEQRPRGPLTRRPKLQS